MELSLILAQKILSLAIVMALGWILVKSHLLSTEDSHTMSVISLYLLCPCVMLSAFQVELTHERLVSLGIAAIAAVVIHGVNIALTYIIRRVTPLSVVEQASLIYSNGGNLVIPLVTAMLGKEYVFYACAFMTVQCFLIWTHGVVLMSGQHDINLKKILLNPNIIATAAALVMFFTRLSFPPILGGAIDDLGNMIGAFSMILTGMIMAGVDLKAVLHNRRSYLISFGRLILLPLACIFLLRLTGLSLRYPMVHSTLLISMLAACAPAAANVTQITQLYRGDAGSAGTINVMSTLLCIITMPIMIYIYQVLC